MIRTFLLACTAMALVACGKRLEPTMVPEATRTVQTDDGWSLELRHHGGEGPPVLLVHGMGANHYNWDYRPEVSPVDELRAAGFDVWVGSLRGDPRTEAPSRRARRRIRFDDHASSDVPALVDGVLEATGAPELLWVGHSMGGMLLYTTLATRPEGIRAGVAIASPATFTRGLKNHAAYRSLGWLVAARRGRMPVRAMVRLGLLPAGALARQLGNPDHLDRALLRGMARHVLVDLPRPVARQARQWIREGALVRADGTPWLTDIDSDVPILVMGAPRDRIAHEPDVAHACALFSPCTYVRLGTEQGFSGDYGHVDPVIGHPAEDEVTPLVLGFLEDHRPDRPVQPAPPEPSVAEDPVADGAAEDLQIGP